MVIQFQINDQLDEILGSIKYSTIDGMIPLDPFYTAEAKAKLQRLIVEAKLSELNALIPIDGLRRADSFDNSVFVVKVGGIHDRIAQLENELEK